MGRAVAKVLRRGSRLGKYRLDRQIGRGAFAEVWKARDTVENRGVALKVTHPDAVTDWGRRAVEREARIASCLHHPGIAVVRNADWKLILPIRMPARLYALKADPGEQSNLLGGKKEGSTDRHTAAEMREALKREFARLGDPFAEKLPELG